MTISRFCGIILAVRITFQNHDQFLTQPNYLEESQKLSLGVRKKVDEYFNEDRRKILNGSVSSIANLIWTAKALNGSEDWKEEIGFEG